MALVCKDCNGCMLACSQMLTDPAHCLDAYMCEIDCPLWHSTSCFQCGLDYPPSDNLGSLVLTVREHTSRLRSDGIRPTATFALNLHAHIDRGAGGRNVRTQNFQGLRSGFRICLCTTQVQCRSPAGSGDHGGGVGEHRYAVRTSAGHWNSLLCTICGTSMFILNGVHKSSNFGKAKTTNSMHMLCTNSAGGRPDRADMGEGYKDSGMLTGLQQASIVRAFKLPHTDACSSGARQLRADHLLASGLGS